MPLAARIQDPVEHGLGMLGMAAGILAGALIGAAMVGTGGLLAVVVVAGAAAAGGLAGEKIAGGLSQILHIGGIETGHIRIQTSPDTNIGHRAAARAKLDAAKCWGLLHHFPKDASRIAQGSDSVFINGQPAARVGDKLECNADIKHGEDTVIIGGGTATVLEISDWETIAHNILVGVVLVTAVIGLGVVAVGLATGALCVTAVATDFAIMAGFAAGSQLAQAIGDKIGPGWGDVLSGATDFAGMGFFAARAVNGRSLMGEPVDAVTGEVCVLATDFQLPGAFPLLFERAYASSLGQDTWLGPNWCCSWSHRVIDAGAGVARYITGDGRAIDFDLPAASGVWLRNQFVNKIRLRRTQIGFEVRDAERRLLRFEHSVGRTWLITSIEDANGRAIRFRYDERGALTRVEHTGGYRLHVESTPRHIDRIGLEQPDGSIAPLVEFQYDAFGRLTGVVNGSGEALRYEYDSAARITRWADREQTWYEYRYDALGRCLEAFGPDDRYHYRFSYDAPRRSTTAIDSFGGVTVLVHNQRLQVVTRHDPMGGVTETEWDERGNKLAVTDPERRRTTLEYDSDGNVVSATDPLGRKATYIYDHDGRLEAYIDAAGTRWERAYDERGNLIQTGLAGREQWRYVRDAVGNLVRVIDPTGESRQYTFNAAGLPLSVSDWAGNVTRYRRDAFGRVTSEIDALGAETRYEYNLLGKLARKTMPNGITVKFQYDREGNLTERVGPDGKASKYEYGPFDQLSAATRPSGARLEFVHDLEGRLSEVRNELGERWIYRFDLNGRTIEERDFSGRFQRYEYDAAGQMVRSFNGKGEWTALERDAGGRLVARRSEDGEEARFAYDIYGRLTMAANGSTTLRFDRDEYGRILREQQGGRAVESEYDPRGLRIKRRATSGELTWDYDPNGRVTRLNMPDGDWLAFTRDAAGREVERRMRGGLIVRQEYDPMDRVISQSAGLAAERQYQYDARNNPIEIAERYWGRSRFAYDADGRIAAAERDTGQSETFRYDAAGRLELRYEGLQKVGDTRRIYDSAGRLIEKHGDGRVWRYEWSVEGRLRRVVTPEGDEWRYEYDPFGRRVRKSGPTGETEYVWDGEVLAEEINEHTNEWIFEPGSFRPVAKREAATGKSWTCLTDQIGTPRELVTGKAKVEWSARLTVWGELEEQRSAETDCPLRFQGQWFDQESGLHYNSHRYYDPSAGEYLSPDPIGLAGGMRPHSYVPSPLTWVDPLGLAGCEVTVPRPDLPEFNGQTSGVLVPTNPPGPPIPLESGPRTGAKFPFSQADGHVETQAALRMQQDNITEATVFHNNPKGTCGNCDYYLPTYLQEGSALTVVPPENAVAPTPRWIDVPKTYTGNGKSPY